MQKLRRSSRAKDELASIVKAHKNIRKISIMSSHFSNYSVRMPELQQNTEASA